MEETALQLHCLSACSPFFYQSVTSLFIYLSFFSGSKERISSLHYKNTLHVGKGFAQYVESKMNKLSEQKLSLSNENKNVYLVNVDYCQGCLVIVMFSV